MRATGTQPGAQGHDSSTVPVVPEPGGWGAGYFS